MLSFPRDVELKDKSLKKIIEKCLQYVKRQALLCVVYLLYNVQFYEEKYKKTFKDITKYPIKCF